MIAETESKNGDKIWKIFLRKHWKMLVLFVLGAILASIGAILIYLWFVENAQLTDLVPATLGLWTMGHSVTFLLHLIFWEFLLIGIPVIIAAAATYFLWWKQLPDKERKEYRDGNLFGKHSRRTDASGGISFLVFIVFCVKVYLDGNWGVAIATWKFNYLVYSCLWALIWILIIFGIPMALGGLWWIRHEMKKKT